MPHYKINKQVGKSMDVRRLAEDWYGAFENSKVIELYHHCKGTKGLCRSYVSSLGVQGGQTQYAKGTKGLCLGVQGGQTQYAFSACDLCGTHPDENVLMLIKVYNTRIT